MFSQLRYLKQLWNIYIDFLQISVLDLQLCIWIEKYFYENDFRDQKPLSPKDPQALQSAVEPLSSPEAQLEMVIRQLEFQNRQLQVILSKSCNSKEITTYMEEHQLHIAVQIEKLKHLRVIDTNLYNHINTNKNVVLF